MSDIEKREMGKGESDAYDTTELIFKSSDESPYTIAEKTQ